MQPLGTVLADWPLGRNKICLGQIFRILLRQLHQTPGSNQCETNVIFLSAHMQRYIISITNSFREAQVVLLLLAFFDFAPLSFKEIAHQQHMLLSPQSSWYSPSNQRFPVSCFSCRRLRYPFVSSLSGTTMKSTLYPMFSRFAD